MAGTLGKLLVTLGLDSSEFSSGLNQAASESEGLASKITGTLGNIALGASIAGIAALGGAFVTAVGNASEAQDVMAQTEAVIKSTGGAAGMSAQQMGDLASSLSSASGLSKFGDEAILTGENLLATFTNIGKDVFPLATQSMVDMATAMGTDVKGGAIQLGKALNDPTKGITALTRVGVTFTEEQQKLIASLQATGDIAGAQKVILAELSKEFGGSAAAAAATFSGKIATLKDKFGELLEGVGTKLLPMLGTFVDTLNSPAVQSGIQAVADGIVNGIGVAVNWLSTAAIPGMVAGWGVLTSVFSATLPYIQPVVEAFTALANFLVVVWTNGDVLNQYLTGIPALLQPVVTIIGDYVNVLHDYFDTIVNVGAALLNGDFMGALMALEAGLQGAAGDLLTYYTDIGTTLASIGMYVATQALVWGQALVTWITPYIPVAIAYLQTLIVAVGDWITAQTAILSGYFMVWATAGGDWVTPYITIALTYLQGLITSIGTWITAQVATLTTLFMAWAVAAYNWIPVAATQFLTVWPTFLNSVMQAIGAAIGPIAAQIGTWAIAFVSWLVPLLPDIVTGLATVAAGIVGFIISTAAVIVANVAQWAIAMLSWIEQNVIPKLPASLGALIGLFTGALKSVLMVIQSAATLISGVFAGLMQMINGDTAAGWATIQQSVIQFCASVTLAIAQFVQTIVTYISGAINNLIALWSGANAQLNAIIAKLVAAALATLSKMATDAVNIGSDIVHGIVNGVSNAAGELYGALKDLASNALAAAKGAILAHSPSKLFASEVGAPITQGIALGVASAEPTLTGSLTSLLGTATAGAKSVAGSVGSTLTSGTLTAAGTAAGKAAIAGLAAGMLSAVGTAKSAAKSATDSITGSFKANLDIHSPSGVFADQIGVPMILGVVEGMNATMPKVLEWVRGNLGKKLAGYLTNAAAMVRGNLDIFTSLHDLEKLDPYQPLVDSTTALTTAQDAAIATSSKLQDVTSQINALIATNATTMDASERVRNNQELTKLYQEQAQIMQDQANSQANLAQLGIAHAQALQASGQQQQAINQIALDAQKQYNDLAAQSQTMMGVDAKRALDFFNMRKAQIQELANLQKQRALATNEDDQRFLDAQIALTRAAQQADTAAAQATVNINVPGGTNDTSTQQITNIINQALKAAGYNTDVRVRTT